MTASATSKKPSSVLKRIVQYRYAYLMIVLTFALLLTFNYYPSFMGLYRAFFNYDVGIKPEFIGLGHFVKMFTKDDIFIESLSHVGILTGWRTFSALVFPFLAAELIYGLTKSAHQYGYRLSMIVPIVVPGMVYILLWQFIYDGTAGLLNALLETVGLGHLQQPWLGNPKTALGAVTLMGFPWVGGVNVLIYLAGLQSISREVVDAALMDGCAGLRRILHIDIPLIAGQFKLIAVLSVIGGLQGWGTVFVMTGGGPGKATMVPGLWMYNNAFFWNRMGYASAIGTFLFVIIMAFTVINMKFVKTSYD
jgi:ABC-type sugar transport system permease subunit